jgi:hypothetical protein
MTTFFPFMHLALSIAFCIAVDVFSLELGVTPKLVMRMVSATSDWGDAWVLTTVVSSSVLQISFLINGSLIFSLSVFRLNHDFSINVNISLIGL